MIDGSGTLWCLLDLQKSKLHQFFGVTEEFYFGAVKHWPWTPEVLSVALKNGWSFFCPTHAVSQLRIDKFN